MSGAIEVLGSVLIVCLSALAGVKMWIDHRERSHKRALEHRPLVELEQRIGNLEAKLAKVQLAPMLGRKFG